MISPPPPLATASAMEESDDRSPYHTLQTKTNQCKICNISFGKLINRPTVCFKCNYSFCHTHSIQQRWNYNQHSLASICDECIDNERKIKIKHRLKNLKLKNSSANGTYIRKISNNSFEYKIYNIRKRAKIISINNKNVESFKAQTIANTLNSIDIPFCITFDFRKCIDNSILPNGSNTDSESYDKPQVERIRRHSAPVCPTIGFSSPMSDGSVLSIFDHDDKLILADDSSSVTSTASHTALLDDIKISQPLSPKPMAVKRDDGNRDNEELKRDLKDLYERMNKFNKKYKTRKLELNDNLYDNDNYIEGEYSKMQQMENEMKQLNVQNVDNADKANKTVDGSNEMLSLKERSFDDLKASMSYSKLYISAKLKWNDNYYNMKLTPYFMTRVVVFGIGMCILPTNLIASVSLGTANAFNWTYAYKYGTKRELAKQSFLVSVELFSAKYLNDIKHIGAGIAIHGLFDLFNVYQLYINQRNNHQIKIIKEVGIYAMLNVVIGVGTMLLSPKPRTIVQS